MLVSVSQFTLKSTKPFRCSLFALQRRLSFPLDWRLFGRAGGYVRRIHTQAAMSTRGASGLVLERHWRMMGALEAMDGMLLFGISTAFIFTVMQAYWSLMTHRPR